MVREGPISGGLKRVPQVEEALARVALASREVTESKLRDRLCLVRTLYIPCGGYYLFLLLYVVCCKNGFLEYSNTVYHNCFWYII